MAVLTQAQIVRRTQVFLEDPSGKRFSPAYLAPWIDQANEDLQLFFQRIGCQMQEQIAIFNVPAAASAPLDLSPYLATGQPLQTLMRPIRIDWKVQGYSDVNYVGSGQVNELDDVTVGNVGCQQWRWASGSIQLTPSYTPVVLRVYFYAYTAGVYDPNAQVMRGTGQLVALQAGLMVAGVNNGMGQLGPMLAKRLQTAKQTFSNLLVMQSQRVLRVPRGTKRGPGVQISAGGSSYI